MATVDFPLHLIGALFLGLLNIWRGNLISFFVRFFCQEFKTTGFLLALHKTVKAVSLFATRDIYVTFVYDSENSTAKQGYNFTMWTEFMRYSASSLTPLIQSFYIEIAYPNLISANDKIDFAPLSELLVLLSESTVKEVTLVDPVNVYVPPLPYCRYCSLSPALLRLAASPNLRKLTLVNVCLPPDVFCDSVVEHLVLRRCTVDEHCFSKFTQEQTGKFAPLRCLKTLDVDDGMIYPDQRRLGIRYNPLLPVSGLVNVSFFVNRAAFLAVLDALTGSSSTLEKLTIILKHPILEDAGTLNLLKFPRLVSLHIGYQTGIRSVQPMSHTGNIVPLVHTFLRPCMVDESSSPLPSLKSIKVQFSLSPFVAEYSHARFTLESSCQALDVTLSHPKWASVKQIELKVDGHLFKVMKKDDDEIKTSMKTELTKHFAQLASSKTVNFNIDVSLDSRSFS